MTSAIIAFILGIIWILGFFVFHVGGMYIHLALVVAIILTLVRMSKNPVR